MLPDLRTDLPPIAPRKAQCTVLLEQLRAGPVHSIHLRREFGIGNPSQRVADLEALGHVIAPPEREQFHTGAWGVVYRLEYDAGGDGTVTRGKPKATAATAAPAVGAEEVPVGDAEAIRLFNLAPPDPLTDDGYRTAA